ncbi:hypothetical protein [Streptomyces sp. NPDC088775]|uniref:hypothetical protein n=1 Tax=Streptomyces sp. NPDC088775 TaxID=3365896 RepID=UPI0038088EA7
MSVAQSGFRLSEADADTLAEEPFTGLSVRLDVKGWLTEPVDGERVADFQVFLDPASLADLVAQGRALQLTLARKARQVAAAKVEAELLSDGRAAFQEMAGPSATRPEELMLYRVIKGLHALPDVSLRRVSPKNPSVKRGGP